jgi:hypothetical protein
VAFQHDLVLERSIFIESYAFCAHLRVMFPKSQPRESKMKQLVALVLSLVFAASSVHAGGPVVVVEEEATVVEEKPASSRGLLPWLAVPLLLCIVMCGPEDEDPPPQ